MTALFPRKGNIIMTRIFIIRHAEAEGNLFRRVQGWHDGKITPRGMRQIAALAGRFKDERIDALYSSDLSRTVTTATAITKYHDIALNIEPQLREVCMGEWENMTWGDVEKRSPEQLANFSSDPDNWHVEGSESFQHLGDRMLEAVLRLGRKHDGQTIVLVSHGMAIRSLHCRVLGVPSRDVAAIPHGDNTCVSLYEYEAGHLTPVYRNDNSHLDSETSTFAHQTWWRKRSGADRNNLRFEQLDLERESDYYEKCYSGAWQAVYGSLDAFDPNAYLMNARRHAADPGCIVKVCSGPEEIGLVELDVRRGAQEGYCWVSLLHLDGEHRHMGYGAQLIGHAVAVAREMDLPRLQLNVAECNEDALRFYRGLGFEQIGTDMGVCGLLRRMQLIIP